MSITQITTHVADALRRLPEISKDLPNTEGLISDIVQSIQDVEDAAWDVLSISLDNAAGATLDQIGELVLLPRAGLSDAAYRARIRVRLLVLNSAGTADELIRIAQLLLAADATLTVNYEASPPAAYHLILTSDVGVPAVDAQVVLDFVEDADAAGVRLEVIYAPSPRVDTFTFDGAGAQAFDNGLWAGALVGE